MDEILSKEEVKSLREFKSRLFDLYWEKFGFFYLHVLPHQSLEIGTRGLVGKEKESGVVLAFGPSACKEISSQQDYLYAELQFGYKWEKLIIPWDCIFRIFDKPHNSITQLKVLFDHPIFDDTQTEKKPQEEISKKQESNVISVDFTGKKK
jgi:hypothetical protein